MKHFQHPRPTQPQARPDAGPDAELERQLAHLLDLIDHYPGSDAAHGLALQLNRIIGQWRAALVRRDRLLYGPIAKGPDHGKAMIATACQHHMGALAAQVEDFARRWSSSALIASAFPRFRTTALLLVAAMAVRLEGDRRLLGETPADQFGPPGSTRMVA